MKISLNSKPKAAQESNVQVPEMTIMEAELSMENLLLQDQVQELAVTNQQMAVENLQDVKKVIDAGNLNNSLVAYLQLSGEFESFIGMKLPTITKENQKEVSKQVSGLLTTKLSEIEVSNEGIVDGVKYAATTIGAAAKANPKGALKVGAIAGGIVGAVVALGALNAFISGWFYNWLLSTRTLVVRAIEVIKKTLTTINKSKLSEETFKAITINFASLSSSLKSTSNKFFDTIITVGNWIGAIPTLGFTLVMGHFYTKGARYQAFKHGNGIFTKDAASSLLNVFEESTKVVDEMTKDPSKVTLQTVEQLLTKYDVKKVGEKYEEGRMTYVTQTDGTLAQSGWTTHDALTFLGKMEQLSSKVEAFNRYSSMVKSFKKQDVEMTKETFEAIKLLFSINWYVVQGLCKSSMFLCMALAKAEAKV